MITPNLLRAATGCTEEAAERFAPHLAEACAHYGIDTADRLASFLAQVGHESGGLRYVREIWGPTPAQQRYEGRADLGNTQPGDGIRYLGRGLIQITGRANSRQQSILLRQAGLLGVPDFEAEPELLEDPRWASWTAAAYWDSRALNALADLDRQEAITRRVNGGNNGHVDRMRRLRLARAAIAKAPAAQDAPPAADQPAAGTNPLPTDGGRTMSPFLAAALPALIAKVPELVALFKDRDKASSEQYATAAATVAEIAVSATGAPNIQAAVEAMTADHAAATAVRDAVRERWFDLAEAGGGGIAGAREANLAAAQVPLWKNPALWVTVGILPSVYMVLAAVLYGHGWSDDIRAMTVSAVLSGVMGTITGYWLGTSAGSQRKTDLLAK